MRRGLLVLGAALLINGGAPMVAAAETARDWFERMGQAVETLNYRGRLVHQHDGQLDTLEVVHQLRDGKVYERMTSLNGSGREVIRRGDDVRCTVADRQEVLVDWAAEGSPLVAVLPQYDASLEEIYRFDLTPASGRVAGRPVHTLKIDPLDGYRYGYRLQLDSETGMPLKCELVDDQNRSIETVMFTRIEFVDTLAAEVFEPLLPTTNYDEVRPVAAAGGNVIDAKQASFVADQLPSGFSLSIVTRHGDAASGAEHLVYTDGVATISVFAERRRENVEVFDGAANIGVANVFGRRL
ncbi:MAG: MucB/RseB C-terminal domain-containing protein, partial [Pseudomonadota bacterium]